MGEKAAQMDKVAHDQFFRNMWMNLEWTQKLASTSVEGAIV